MARSPAYTTDNSREDCKSFRNLCHMVCQRCLCQTMALTLHLRSLSSFSRITEYAMFSHHLTILRLTEQRNERYRLSRMPGVTRLEAQFVSPHLWLARFLFTYRNTLHTVTERTPAELFLKTQPRTRLSLLKPDISKVVVKRQLQQKGDHDRQVKPLRMFNLGERVLV